MKPKVFFPVSPEARKWYWTDDVLDRLYAAAEVVEPESFENPWESCKGNIQGLIIGWGVPRLPRTIWRKMESLRVISIYGGSAVYMESPVEALRQGIILANASPEMGEAVAETTLALILASQYNIVSSSNAYKAAGKLTYSPEPSSTSLVGSTVGLIGFGFIGRKVAELLQPFNVRLLIYDPYVAPDAALQYNGELIDLYDLLQQSDVVSLHAGWTRETEGMLGAVELNITKPNALIVSTARMPIFDQRALADCVLKGRLRFAGDFIPFDKDIWSTKQMRECGNLLAVHGHTSVTGRSVYRMAQKVVANIEQVFAGKEPDNKITEEWIKRTT